MEGLASENGASQRSRAGCIRIRGRTRHTAVRTVAAPASAPFAALKAAGGPSGRAACHRHGARRDPLAGRSTAPPVNPRQLARPQGCRRHPASGVQSRNRAGEPARARATDRADSRALRPLAACPAWPELAPETPARALLGCLGRSAAACIAVIGHEPQVSALLGECLPGGSASQFTLRKMGAALLRFRGRARPGRGQLVGFAPPRPLRAARWHRP